MTEQGPGWRERYGFTRRELLAWGLIIGFVVVAIVVAVVVMASYEGLSD